MDSSQRRLSDCLGPQVNEMLYTGFCSAMPPSTLQNQPMEKGAISFPVALLLDTCSVTTARRRAVQILLHVQVTGADPGQDPTPKGGGPLPPPPFYRPQNGCTEQWVLWAPEAPEILF